MKLRDRLLKAAESTLKEGVESTKEIMSNNIVPSFDDMGMANVTPGEFSQEEITNAENLVNKGSMSNDTEFNKADKANDPVSTIIDTTKDMIDGLLNISEPEDTHTIQVVKTNIDEMPEGKEHCDCHRHGKGHGMFGHHGIGHIIESVMGGKSCEEYLASLKESDYAGPRDFVPDVRINASDVLNAIKAKVGEGSEGVNVVQDVDADNNHIYKISQIDTKKLPKELHVENIMLKLNGDVYSADKMAKDFPLKTSK